MNHPSNWSLNCPIPISADAERISLAHGEGARLSRRLIAETILPRVASAEHTAFADAARVTTIGCRLAICTDSHTVSPLFFFPAEISAHCPSMERSMTLPWRARILAGSRYR